MTDTMTGLFDLLRVREMTCNLERLNVRWGVKVVQPSRQSRFFLSVSGSSWISLLGSKDPIKLEPGDIAIIPATDDAKENTSDPVFSLADPARDPAYGTSGLVPDMEDGQNALLLCGTFEISKSTPSTILELLPAVLTARHTDDVGATTFDRVVDLTIEEVSQSEPPSQVTLNRLTEMLCVHALRHWFEAEVPKYPNLQALIDPRTKLVLDEIQKDPARPWTVETLAKLYGQSRTAFSAHFKLAVGVSPMSYIRQRRIQLSCLMLEDGSTPLDVIAFKSGYTDTNAFCRAFRREIGCSPGSYRKQTP